MRQLEFFALFPRRLEPINVNRHVFINVFFLEKAVVPSFGVVFIQNYQVDVVGLSRLGVLRNLGNALTHDCIVRFRVVEKPKLDNEALLPPFAVFQAVSPSDAYV